MFLAWSQNRSIHLWFCYYLLFLKKQDLMTQVTSTGTWICIQSIKVHTSCVTIQHFLSPLQPCGYLHFATPECLQSVVSCFLNTSKVQPYTGSEPPTFDHWHSPSGTLPYFQLLLTSIFRVTSPMLAVSNYCWSSDLWFASVSLS